MAENYTLRSAGFAEMAVGPEMQRVMASLGEEAKGIAESLSTDFVVSGDYIGSFESDVEIIDLPGGHPVAAAIVRNTSGHAVAVEYGYEGRHDAPTGKAHRVFGRTLAAMGAT